MRRPPATRPGTAWCRIVGLFSLLALAACRPPQVEEPLFDTLHQPLVLTESTAIALPNSSLPNRLVKGWREPSKQGAPRFNARPGALIQGVHLGGSGRKLILAAEVTPKAKGSLEVRIADREWRTYPLAKRIRIPLPSDLPLGRFTVGLRLPENHRLRLKQAGISSALPAGETQVGESSLVQSGFSIVETVRRLDGDAVLSGQFRPPSNPSPDQRFSIRLQRTDGSEETVFEWGQTGSRDTGAFEIRLPADEWIRIRFVALGEGPAARWSDLTFRSRQPVAAAPAPAPRPPRVVILYVMDALRSDFVNHLGGPEGVTPVIDRLASEGATFRSHFSVAPNTVPSMKSLFTGQTFLLKGGWKLTPESGPTLAQRFQTAGYRTGLFSGNGNVSTWRGMNRGFDRTASGALWKPDSGAEAGYNNNAETVHQAALDWIADRQPDDNLFLHLQTIHPHNPYAPPEPFLSRYTADIPSDIDGRTRTLLRIKRAQRAVTEADQQRLRGLYAGGAAYNDDRLQGFLDAVLERYPRHEVLFILTSDHGEELFEHGGVLHGYTLYDEMLRIPLVVWWPGVVSPQEISVHTDTLDLYASLASLATQGEPISGGGRTLWPHLVGAVPPDAEDREVIFASASAVRGGIFMARSPRYKFILAPRTGTRGQESWGMGQGLGRSYEAEYLFDLLNDPGETTNLAGENILEADWLRARLIAWIEAGKAIESGAALDDMDEEARESLRALGYLQ